LSIILPRLAGFERRMSLGWNEHLRASLDRVLDCAWLRQKPVNSRGTHL
jgi:hypothetical protein